MSKTSATKRLICLILATIMVFSMMPMTGYAEDNVTAQQSTKGDTSATGGSDSGATEGELYPEIGSNSLFNYENTQEKAVSGEDKTVLDDDNDTAQSEPAPSSSPVSVNDIQIVLGYQSLLLSEQLFENAKRIVTGKTFDLKLEAPEGTVLENVKFFASTDKDKVFENELEIGVEKLCKLEPGNYYLGFTATVNGQYMQSESGKFGLVVKEAPAMMLTTSNNAYSNDANSNSIESAEPTLLLSINGGEEKDCAYSPEIYFGDTVSFRVIPNPPAESCSNFNFSIWEFGHSVEEASIFHQSNDNPSNFTFNDNRFEAIKYSLLFSYSYQKDNATIRRASNPDINSLVINAVPISAPSITWDGFRASFSSTKTINGVDVTPAKYKYEVIRYYIQSRAETSETVATGEGNSVDIADLINNHKSGRYCVKAQAISNDYTHFADSEWSELSAYNDVVAPKITKDISVLADNITLSATVKDTPTGIEYYAFSTKGSSTAAEADRSPADASKTPGEELTFQMKPNEAGTYKFYAWDYSGNVAESTGSVTSTAVTYKDYYENGESKEIKEYVLNDLSRPIIKAPARDGYKFLGCYQGDTKYTSDTVDKNTGTLTARWEKVDLTIDFDRKTSQSGTAFIDNETYSGPITITASTKDTYDKVTWEWKDASGATVSSNKSYKVTNTATSGAHTYTVTAKAVIEGTESTATATITVQILPKTLTVTINDYRDNLTFRDEALTPDNFTYTVTGFVNGETEETAAGYSFTPKCSYKKGDNAGVYDIDADAAADNYVFDIKKGKLNVLSYEITEDSEVSIVLDKNTFIYNGEEQRAVVNSVTVDGESVSAEDYDVSYSSNITDVGTPSAILTFKRNYSGTVSKVYSITPAQVPATVSIDNWTYDALNAKDATHNLKLNSTVKLTEGEIKYYFFDSTGKQLDEAPVDAGSYKVSAVITPNDHNYATTTTGKVDFNISKYAIKIFGRGMIFTYDGEEHSFTGKDAYYIQHDGSAITELKGTDAIKSVELLAKVKDVTTDDNPVYNVPSNVTFTNNTNKENYAVTLALGSENGKLEVGTGKLSAPIGLSWKDGNPGLATWTPVVADGLGSVIYEVQLYRDGNPSAIFTQASISTAFVNLSAAIKKDYSDAAEYTFKVKAIPGEEGKFQPSEYSEESPELYTIKLVTKEGTGVASAYITGTENQKEIILIKGEKTNITAVQANGYSFTTGTQIWSADKDASVNITDKTSSSTDVTANNDSAVIVTVTAVAQDNPPVFTPDSFKPENLDNGSVTLSFIASDEVEVKKWAITKESDINNVQWNSCSGTSITASINLDPKNSDSTGTYYAYVSDGTTAVKETYTVDVYKLTFADGGTIDSTSATGTVDPVLKGQNKNITLPANGYTRPNYSFQGWKDNVTGNIFSAGGTYTENGDRTLTADWLLTGVAYTVNYYYEKVNNNLNSVDDPDPDLTVTIRRTGQSGEQVRFIKDGAPTEQFALNKLGFKFDKCEFSGCTPVDGTITLVDGENPVINIYYKRETYTLNYDTKLYEDKTITKPDKSSYNYKYEWPINYSLIKEEKESETKGDYAKPFRPGYTFIGWSYNDSYSKPETMPANDIKATGSFSANQANYQVLYYTQNLDGTYTYQKSYTEGTDGSLYGFHDEDYNGTFDVTNSSNKLLKKISGFNAYSVTMTYDKPSDNDKKDSAPDNKTLSGKYDELRTQYIVYYYSRNSYKLTLKVVKAPRENNTVVFEYTVPVAYAAKPLINGSPEGYSEKVDNVTDFDKFENYALYASGAEEYQDNELWRKYSKIGKKELEGYRLANYADWTTGNRPSTMPDEDVTVIREYVQEDRTSYTVNVFLENNDGSYPKEPNGTITYEATANVPITIGNGKDYNLNLDALANAVKGSGSRNFKKDNLTITSNQIVDNTSGKITYGFVVYKYGDMHHEPLVVNVYAERKEVTNTILYICENQFGEITFAKQQIKGKYGEKFGYGVNLYFDENKRNEIADYETKYPTVKIIADNLTNKKGDIVTDPSQAAKIDGNKNGLEYGFRYNDYVICRGQDTFTTVKEIDETTYESTLTGGTTRIYYTTFFKSYVCNLTYHYGNLKYKPKDGSTQADLTIESGGTTYKLRAINKCDLFYNEQSYIKPGEAEYPGAKLIPTNVKYTYPEGNKLQDPDNWKELNVNGVTYYTTTLDDGGDYLYIPAENSPFFYGVQASYLYSELTKVDNETRLKNWIDYYNNYKNDHSETSEEPDEQISTLELLPTNYGGTGALRYYHFDEEKEYNLFKDPAEMYQQYKYGTYYTLTHVFGDYVQCSKDDSTAHSYKAGTNGHPYATFETSKTGHNADHHLDRPGYAVKWYTDQAYTAASLVDSTIDNITMSKDITVYGRYEKIPVLNHKYVYYQLADGSYKTMEEIDAVGVPEDVEVGKTFFVDGIYAKVISKQEYKLEDTSIGKTTIAYGNVVEYKLGSETGETIAFREIEPALSFSELKGLQFDSDTYKKANYHIDTAKDIYLNGTCITERINLFAYYARDYKTLVEDENYPGSLQTTDRNIWGDNVTIEAAGSTTDCNGKYTGYVFDNWSFYKTCTTVNDRKVYSDQVSFEDIQAYVDPVTRNVSFIMPTYTLYAVGEWVPGSFIQDINHYFPDSTKNYDTALVNTIKKTLGDLSKLQFSTGTIQGTAGYIKTKTDDDGYIVELYDCREDNETLTDVNLVYKVQRLKATHLDASKKYADFVLTDENSSFECSKAVRRYYYPYDEIAKEELATTALQFMYPCGVDYYYEGKDVHVNAAVIATDNGAINNIKDDNDNSTVTGTGIYNFREKGSLNAVVAGGYSFAGWYLPDAETEDKVPLFIKKDGKYSYNENVTEAQRKTARLDNNSLKLDFQALTDKEYIALIVPAVPGVPKVTVGGTNRYTFGYSYGEDLTAVAAMSGEGLADIEVSKWLWEEYDNSTGTWITVQEEDNATYVFPIGKASGEYTYRATAYAQNIYNGRITTGVSDNYTVTVVQANLELAIASSAYVYDAIPHGTELDTKTKDTYINWDKINEYGIKLYYAVGNIDNKSQITKELTKEILDNLTYTNADTYYISYYATSTQKDYVIDEQVHKATITIVPRDITVESIKVFEKMYDGTNLLTDANKDDISKALKHEPGDNTTAQNKFIKVTGICANDNNTYFITFDTNASYNNAHVKDANSIVLSNFCLTTTEGGKDYHNYRYADGSAISFGAKINPAELGISWYKYDNDTVPSETISYNFDFSSHEPVARIDSGIISPEKPQLVISTKDVDGDPVDVGTYTAIARVNDNATVQTEDNYTASDYVIKLNSKEYKIVELPLFIKPVADETHPDTVTYDGKPHAYSTFKSYDNSTGTLKEYNLPEGYSIQAVPYAEYTDAGTYSIIAKSNEQKRGALKILSDTGKDVTDDFNIALLSTPITIQPRKVAVKGITAEDKVYDANTHADLVFTAEDGETSSIVYENVVPGESLKLITGNLTGKFDNASVGNDKVVYITYSKLAGEEAFTRGDNNTKPSNYVLDNSTEGFYDNDSSGASQHYNTQLTTNADITEAGITVALENSIVTYGDNITIVPIYKRANGTTFPIGSVTGTIKLTIVMPAGPENKTFEYTIPSEGGKFIIPFETAQKPDASATAYTVRIDNVSQLVGENSGNFEFTVEQDVGGEDKTSTLKVNRRPVNVWGISSEEKDYDATDIATLIFADESIVIDNVTSDENLKLNENASYIITGKYKENGVSAKDAGEYSSTVPSGKYVQLVYSKNEIPGEEIFDGADANTKPTNYYLVSANSQPITQGKINPRPVAVVPDAAYKTYGQSNSVNSAELKWHYTNFPAGGDQIDGVTIIRVAGEEVGKYTISVILPDVSVNKNYVLSNPTTADFTINKATITVKANKADSITYRTDIVAQPVSTATGFINVSYDDFRIDDSGYYSNVLDAVVDYYFYNSNGEKVADNATIVGKTVELDVGTYGVLPVVNNNIVNEHITKNYYIKCEKGSIEVKPITGIRITSGITAVDRLYNDNKTEKLDLIDATLDLSGAVFEGIAEVDRANLKIENVKGKYDDKDVSYYGEKKDENIIDKTVILDYSNAKLGGSAAKNYSFNEYSKNNSQKSTEAKILPVVITIRAFVDGKPNSTDTTSPVEVKYGVVPKFTATYAGFVNGENEQNLNGNLVLDNDSYTVDAAPDKHFVLKPSGYNQDNYKFNYISQEFVIVKNKLETPAPSWNRAEPGTITWNKVPDIVDAKVKKYSLTLYKDNSAVTGGTATVERNDNATYSTDVFRETIRANGKGAYTVKIKAVPDNLNLVDESAEGTSAVLYAKNITLKYDSNTDTNNGRLSGSYNVAIKEVNKTPENFKEGNDTVSYVLIAGEGTDFYTLMKNPTGYFVENTTSSDAKLTVGSFTPAPDNYTESKYENSMSLAKDLSNSNDVTVTVTLKARPATVSATMKAYYNEAEVAELIYGYSADNVSITTYPSVGENDNIKEEGYTYTVKPGSWRIWDQYGFGPWTVVTGLTDFTWNNTAPVKFPGNMTVPEASGMALYPIECIVIATRNDNAMQSEFTAKMVLPVKQAKIYPKLYDLEWTYGETRGYAGDNANVPGKGVVSQNPEGAQVSFYYSSTLTHIDNITGDNPPEGLIAGRPTNKGVWYCYAYVYPSPNFLGSWTNLDDNGKSTGAKYIIRQAKLADVDNLTLSITDGSAPYYGLAKWNEVKTFDPKFADNKSEEIVNHNNVNLKENLGVDSKSYADVRYTMTLKDPDCTETVLGKNILFPNTMTDFTPYLTKQGDYVFSVIATSLNKPDSAILNCIDSDPVSQTLSITKEIEHDKALDRIYDGTPTTLSIKGADPSKQTFEWFKVVTNPDSSTSFIPAGSSPELKLYDVSESGLYTCFVKETGVAVHFSTSITVKINKRDIEFTADSDNKTYDGFPLRDKGFTVKQGELIGIDNTTVYYTQKDNGTVTTDIHTVTLSMTNDSQQTDAHTDSIASKSDAKFGRHYNTIDTNSISIIRRYNNGTTVDATPNYNISTVKGELKVTKKDLSDSGKVTMEVPENKTYTGIAHEPEPIVNYTTDNGTVWTLTKGTDFTYSYENNTNVGKATVTATGTGDTGNYTGSISRNFFIDPALLTITAKNKTITYGEDAPTYTTAQAKDTEAVSFVGLVNEEDPTTVLGGSRKLAYTYQNLTDNYTKASYVGTYVITPSDWTSPNYTITFVPGNLTVQQRAITIKSKDYSHVYDGHNHIDANDPTELSVTSGQLVNGDNITAVSFIENSTDVISAKNVFDNASVQIKRAGADVKFNYAVTYDYGTFNITKRPITLLSGSAEKVYDGDKLNNFTVTDKTKGLTDKGYVGGEVFAYGFSGTNIKNVTDTETGNNKFTVTDNATTGAKVSNYAITLENGTLTIKARPIELQSGSATKVYDGTQLDNHTVTDLTAEQPDKGYVKNQVFAYTFTCDTNRVIDVVDNEANNNTFTVADNATNGALLSNYSIKLDNGTLAITPILTPILIKADNATKVYDGSAITKNTYTVTPENIILKDKGDTLNVTVAGSQTDAGTSTNAVTAYNVMRDSKVITSNYTFATPENGTLTITPRPITLRSGNATKMYDGDKLDNFTVTDLTKGETGKGYVNGEVFAYNFSGTIIENVTQSVEGNNKYTVESETAKVSNYAITLENGTLTITPRDVTIKSGSAKREYNGEDLDNKSVTFAGNGFVSGQGATYTNFAKIKDVGTKENTFTYTLFNNTTASNYTITVENGTLEIVQKSEKITIYADNNTKVYDGQPLSDNDYTYTQNVLEAGDVLTATVEGTITNVGSVKNVVTGWSVMRGSDNVTANYTFTTPENGTLTVTKRPVTISSKNFIYDCYDGTAHKDNNSVADIVATNLVGGHNVTAVNFTGERTLAGTTENGNTFDGIVIKDASENDVTSNYNITPAYGNLTITRRPITIVTPDYESVYNGKDQAYTFDPALDYLKPGCTLGEGDNITEATFAKHKDAGTYTNGNTVNANSLVIKNSVNMSVTDSYIISYENGTVTITPRPITLRSGNATKMYDGDKLDNFTVTDLTKGETGKGYVNGEVFAYAFSDTNIVNVADTKENNNGFTVANNGNAKVTNYAITLENGTLTITPRDVKLTSGSAKREYNGEDLDNKSVTVSGSGFVAGQGADYSNFATIKDVGTKENTFTYTLFNNTTASNYTITVENGTLEVIPKSAEITIYADNNTKVYDGQALTDSGYSYTQNVLETGDEITATVEGTITDVGTAKNVVTGWSVMRGSDNVTANYTFTTPENGTLTVTKRPITLRSENATKMYDGSKVENTTVVDVSTGADSGFVNGQEFTYDFSGTNIVNVAQTAEHNNVYTIENKTANTDNYEITATYGKLSITPRDVTLTSENATKSYDGTDLKKESVIESGSGFVSGQGADYTNFATIKDVGVENNTFSYAPKSGTDFNNYSIAVENGTLTITAKSAPITIKAADATKVYDGNALTNSNFTYTEGVLVDGDNLTAVVEGTITDAGSANNVVTSYKVKRDGKDITNNYTFATRENGTLTVTKRPITLRSENATKMYDGSKVENTTVVDISTGADSGFVNGQEFTYDFSGTNIVNVAQTAEHNNVYTIENKTANTDNYEITATYGKLSITPRDVTLTSENATKSYDGTDLKKESVIESGNGFVSGQGATYSNFATIKDVGTKANTFTYTFFENTTASNYAITVENGTLTITQNTSKIKIKAASASKMYDGTPLTNDNFTYTGTLAAGDNLTAVIEGEITNVGMAKNVVKSYTVLRGDVDVTNNYNFEPSDNGTLTVTKRNIKFTSASDEREYNGQPLENHTVSVSENGFAPGESATFHVQGKQLDAGESANWFTFDFSTKENYSITIENGTLKVNPVSKQIILTADNASKTYDGTPLTKNSYKYTEGVLVGGDLITATVEGTITNAGTTSNRVTGWIVKRGEDNITANYTFGTPENGTLTVTPRTIEITAASDTKEYDGTPLTKDNYSITDGAFVDDQGFASVTATGSQTIVGSSLNTITAYTFKGNTKAGNYKVENKTGTLTVTDRTVKFPVSITAKSLEVTYDGSSHTVSGFENLTVKANGLDFTVSNVTSTATGTKVKDSVDSIEITGTPVVKDALGNDVSAQFNVTMINGHLKINPRPVKIAWDNVTQFTYDATQKTINAYITNICGSDNVTLVLDNNTKTMVGDYVAVITGLDGGDSGNYTLEGAEGEFCKPWKINFIGTIAINLAGYEAQYDGEKHSITVVSTNPDNCTITYSLDNETFSANNPEYDNVTGEPVTVFVKAEKIGYTTGYNQATVNITPQIVYPPENRTVPYNGQLQYSAIRENATEYKTYNKSWKDVGTYPVRLELYDNVNYKWVDSANPYSALNLFKSAAKQNDKYADAYFTITPAKPKLALKDNVSLSKVYDGEAFPLYKDDIEITDNTTRTDGTGPIPYDGGVDNLTFTWIDNKTGATSTVAPKNAGTYKVVVTLPAHGNWSDADPIEFYAVIEPKVINLPAKESKVYNGYNQSSEFPDTADYTVENINNAKDVDNYTVKLTLTDPANTKWADKPYGVDNSSAILEITKATPYVSIKPKTVNYTGKKFTVDNATITFKGLDNFTEGKDYKIVYYYYSDEACTKLVGTDGASAAGVYYVLAVLTPTPLGKMSRNYKEAWSDKTTLRIVAQGGGGGGTRGGGAGTGDEFNAEIWITTMAFTGLMATAAILAPKKKKKEEDE